jgi:hypothetical protein
MSTACGLDRLDHRDRRRQVHDGAGLDADDPQGLDVRARQPTICSRPPNCSRKSTATLAETYASKTGKKADEFSELMAQETWFSRRRPSTPAWPTKWRTMPKKRRRRGRRALWDLCAFEGAPAPPAPPVNPIGRSRRAEQAAADAAAGRSPGCRGRD